MHTYVSRELRPSLRCGLFSAAGARARADLDLIIVKMAAEVEGQFAGVEVVLQQEETRAFADGRELGPGLLSVEER